MTLEELWELFPIFLVPHNEAWKEWFREEKEHLEDLLPSGMIKGIHHIGSTCIPTIMAKSIVDILVVVNEGMADVKRVLLDCGYLLMSESPARVSLTIKGIRKGGFRKGCSTSICVCRTTSMNSISATISWNMRMSQKPTKN